MGQENNPGRIISAIGVAILHALLGYALIMGLGVTVARDAGDDLKIFFIPQEPPPPPVETPAPARASTEARQGAASPANVRAQPAPIVAPPVVRLDVPPPIVAAPVQGPSDDPSAGASNRAGPGSGSGGLGVGTGSGGAGDGPGGGVAMRAQLVRGRIVDRDYPRTASRAGAGGTVFVRFTVETDGRVAGCTVTQSSGNEDLDATTCRLIERRFRYAPARDAEGRAVPEVRAWEQVWWLEPR